MMPKMSNFGGFKEVVTNLNQHLSVPIALQMSSIFDTANLGFFNAKELDSLTRIVRNAICCFSLIPIEEFQNARGITRLRFNRDEFKPVSKASKDSREKAALRPLPPGKTTPPKPPVDRKWDFYGNRIIAESDRESRVSPVSIQREGVSVFAVIFRYMIHLVNTNDTMLRSNAIDVLLNMDIPDIALLRDMHATVSSSLGQQILLHPKMDQEFNFVHGGKANLQTALENAAAVRSNITQASESLGRFFLNFLKIAAWQAGVNTYTYGTSYTLGKSTIIPLIQSTLSFGCIANPRCIIQLANTMEAILISRAISSGGMTQMPTKFVWLSDPAEVGRVMNTAWIEYTDRVKRAEAGKAAVAVPATAAVTVAEAVPPQPTQVAVAPHITHVPAAKRSAKRATPAAQPAVAVAPIIPINQPVDNDGFDDEEGEEEDEEADDEN
jgi:hypothetical protein